jgi:hypothetical protein
MTRHRNNIDFVKTLKDYAVPLIGLFLIIILLFNIFSDDKNIESTPTNTEINDNNI